MPSAYSACVISLSPGAPPREVVRAMDYGYAVAAVQAVNPGAGAVTIHAWLLPAGASVAHVVDAFRVAVPLTVAAGASAPLLPQPIRLGPGQALAVAVTGADIINIFVTAQEISP